jgi:hypothetical protein
MSRPEKPIDWKKVDDLLMAGCLGTEICAHFDMHHETFYNRVKDEYGMGFTAYAAEKRQRGDSILRAKQFETALKGNVTMQIWLGKNRLNQREYDMNRGIESLITDLKNYSAAMKEGRPEQPQAQASDHSDSPQ